MAAKKSLLDLAERVDPSYERRSGGPKATLASKEERLELCLALIDRQITPKQAAEALKSRGYSNTRNSAHYILGAVLYAAARNGSVKVTRAK